jgi:hypothetical protein
VPNALKAGDRLQAWYRGKIYHAGRVLMTYPALGLVTIRTPTREVRLIDAQVLEIVGIAKQKYSYVQEGA